MFTQSICKRCGAIIYFKQAATSCPTYCYACKKILGFTRLHRGNEKCCSSYPFICETCHHEFNSLKRLQRVCDVCEEHNVRESMKQGAKKQRHKIKSDPILSEKYRNLQRECAKQRLAKIKADPVLLAKYLKKARLQSAQQYQKVIANPVLAKKRRAYDREHQSKRMQKIKSDPLLLEEYRDKQREKKRQKKLNTSKNVCEKTIQ